MRTWIFRAGFLSLFSLAVCFRASAASQFVSDFNAGLPVGSSLVQDARIISSGGVNNSGALRLTAATGGQQGTYYIDDFTAGTPVTRFKLLARVAVGGGTARPADGMSFSFGTDLGAGSFGEEGAGTGITVTFDTWDNAGDDTAPAIDLRFGGGVIAFQSMSTGGAANPFREGGRAPAGTVLTDSLGNPVDLQTFGSGTVTPTDASFVNLVIELFDDNTIGVSWSNVVVLNRVPIPYSPISAGRFALGARTGGATEVHLVDNLQIFANFVPGPASLVTALSDQTVNEGSAATFSVAVDGTPPFTVQWFSNNVAIPGADQLTHTTPPANLGMNGAVYRVEVRNPENVTAVVASATLHVVPALVLQSVSSRNQSDKVFVTFSKPVTRSGTYTLTPSVAVNSTSAGATGAEVVLNVAPLTPETTYTLTVSAETGTDGSTLRPDPSTGVFHFGFGAFCHDFNDGTLPPGTALAGVGALPDGSIHLTDAAQFGVCGAFFVPDQLGGAPLDRLQVRWRSLVGRGGGGGADGYSFNWAADVAGPGTCAGSEEGSGSGLSVTVDTFDNGAGEAPGIEIKWKGTRTAFAAIPKEDPGNGIYLRKGQFVDASVEVLPNGQATFNYDGTVISSSLPGWEPMSGGNFQFVGRTGGASDDQWIDDLRINCFSLTPPVFTAQPTNTTAVEGDPATYVVRVDGAPPLSLQWFTNGVPVPGAITTSYTTPPATPALEALQVSVLASNEFGTTPSATATLHVQLAPRLVKVFTGCEDNLVHVLYTKPVQLNGNYSLDVVLVNGKRYGTNQAEVLLDTDPLPPGSPVQLQIENEHDQGANSIYPNPTTAVLAYGFGSFCSDFSALPNGASLGGGAVIGSDGVLHLTEALANGACGSLFIPDQNAGAGLDRLHVTWKSRVGGGNAGADGYSFNWARDIATGSGCPGTPEEGVGMGLSVTVDTFDNGAPTDVGGTGIQIKWQGKVVAFGSIPKDMTAGAPTFIRKDTFVDAQLDVLPTGAAQFTYDGVTIVGVLPGFVSLAGANFMVAGRTGGANDNHWVDDLCINSLIPDSVGPVILGSSRLVVGCTAPQTPVAFNVSAYDFCEGSVPVTSTPASGSNFPIGATTVTSTARDSLGNTTTRSFVVEVQERPLVLSIRRSANQVMVSWPQTCANFALEETAALVVPGPGTWTAVGTPPVSVGTNFQTTLPIGTENRFFRLRSQ